MALPSGQKMGKMGRRGNYPSLLQCTTTTIPRPIRMSSFSNDFFPAVLDREINSFDADVFGHRDYASALASLIVSERLAPPYSIGLLGSWGSGKSSVKAMCIRHVQDQIEQKSRFKIITFNAWRFGGENIKRALLREVFLALGGNIEDYNDRLFRTIEKTKKEARQVKDLLCDLWERTGWPIIVTSAFSLIGLLILSLFYGLLWCFGITGENAVLPISLSTPVLLYFYCHVFKWALLSLGPIHRYSDIKQTHEPRSSAEEFEEMLKEQLEKYARSHSKCARIVIFVDDLDRLSASEMVEGLDTIRSFLDLQHINKPGIIFVISCDEQRIAEALTERNLQRWGTEAILDEHHKSSARRYLDRIFQFRLEIPAPPKLDLSGYARFIMEEHFSDIVRLLNEKNVFEDVISILIPVNVHNPRNILQLVNAFCQSWSLAVIREREGAGTHRPGGLSEGVVTQHPISLAAVTALRVNFPDFFNDLLADPGLIGKFAARFIHKNPDILTEDDEFRTFAKYRRDDETNQDGMRPEYYSLRQYISSIQGIRLPTSLQPLLLLAQDPITRKYRDGANEIYNAFISGDHVGLLQRIGRGNDDLNISLDDIQLLRQFSDDLINEPQIRRDNAAVCLASIFNRLPQATAHLLVVPVARELVKSLDLRSRLGVDSIFALLKVVKQEDRFAVISSLMDDILDNSKDIQLRNQNNQNFSVTDAGQVIYKCCKYFLDTRNQEGKFGNKDDERFLSWLLHRNFKIAGESKMLPDTWFIEQFETHKSHLLPSLREKYSAYVIGLFSDDKKLDEQTVSKAIQHCKDIFSVLLEEGEESRTTLWSQLCDLGKVRNKNACEMAWDFAKSNINNIQSKEQFSNCITACITRLKQTLLSDMSWKDFDDRLGWKFLHRAFEERYRDIADDIVQALVAIVTESFNQGEIEEILSIAAVLLENQSPHILNLIKPWIEKIATINIDISYSLWVATNYLSLPQDLQTSFIDQCNSLVSSHKNEESNYYREIALRLADISLGDTQVASHFNSLCSQLTSIQSSSWNAHQKLAPNYFSVIAKILEKGTAETWKTMTTLGQMLTLIFTPKQSASRNCPPFVQESAHRCLAEKWLAISKLNNCDPQAIFSHSLNLLPSASETMSDVPVMISLSEMIRNHIVPVERESELLSKIMPLWSKYPNEILEILEAFETSIPTPEMLVQEAKQDTPPENLKHLWTTAVPWLDADSQQKFIVLVLSKSSENYANVQDGFLSLAVDTTEENMGDILSSLLMENNQNTEQRCRIWQQIINRVSTWNHDWILNVLKNVLCTSPPSELISYFFDTSRRDLLTNFFKQCGQSTKLGIAQLEIMIESQSQDIRNQTAQWMLAADLTQQSLERIHDYTAKLTSDKIQFFKDKFPTHKAIKKLKF